jgi:hypothetical protein
MHAKEKSVPISKPSASFLAPLTESDSLTIKQFSDLFGFPVPALIVAIERNRGVLRKPFYSIADLADRWVCSRGTVYNVLADHEASALQLIEPHGKQNRGKRSIPASTVERIERALTVTINKVA